MTRESEMAQKFKPQAYMGTWPNWRIALQG